MTRASIDKARVRASLPARAGTYWGGPIAAGLALGFRKTRDGAAGAWAARATADDGRIVAKSMGQVTAANTYEVARAAAINWHKQMAAGVDTTEVKTVADACARYLANLERYGRNDAATDARRRFKRYVDDAPLGSVKLTALRTEHIEQWRDGVAEPDDDGDSLAPASLNRLLTALKAALNHAVEKRFIGADRVIEWQTVKPFKVNARRELFLDRDQRRALVDNAQSPARELILACALTGARSGEVARATVKQWDTRLGAMTFDGKTGARTVPVSDAAADLFDEAVRGKKPDEFMFTRNGAQWKAWDWCDPVREAASSAGLPAGTCLYTLRHSFITESIASGMSLLEVARLVGTSLAMIDKHYGHLVQDSTRRRLAGVNIL